RARLAQLEPAVNAVARAERRRKNQTRLERGTAAVLQIGVQDVRRVREQVRPQVLAHFALRELGEVVDELGFRVSPGEVRIRLREAGFTQSYTYFKIGRA